MRANAICRLARILIALLIAGGAVTAVAAASLAFVEPTITRRFQVTVRLQSGSDILVGSTVWEMAARRQLNPFGNGTAWDPTVRGEAIAFPLAEDKALFVLRKAKDELSSRSFGAFLFSCGPTTVAELRSFEGGCTVPYSPEIVVVDGDLDSEIVPAIKEAGSVPGYSVEVVSMEVKTTDKEVTTGLVQRYPWIINLQRPMSPSSDGSGTIFRGIIYSQDFSTEIESGNK